MTADEAEQREGAEEPQLLGDGGEDEVGLDERDRRRAAEGDEALPQALAEDAATAERVQRAHLLEAGAERVGERVEPDVEPRLHVGEQLVRHEGATDEQERGR